MEDASLEGVLDEEMTVDMGEEEAAPPAEEETEVITESQGEEDSETPSEETPAPEPEEESAQPDPLEEMRKEMAGLKSALTAERQKRQEAQQAAEKKDFWDDPDAAIGSVEAKFDQKLREQRFDMSEEFAASRYNDYSEMREKFMELAQHNPALADTALTHRNPGEYMYQTAAKHKMVEEMGDPVAYKQKLEAEIKAKLEAEIKAKEAKHKETADSLPPSAASIPSSGSNTEKIVVEESLDDVLG